MPDPAPNSPEALRAGLAGRYEIERELGAGGMAVVYLAHDVARGRRVALKVLRPELGSIIGGDRFQREIALVAQLVHPHILPLLDSGETAGRRAPLVHHAVHRGRVAPGVARPGDAASAGRRGTADA